jgi:hypothetical protein
MQFRGGEEKPVAAAYEIISRGGATGSASGALFPGVTDLMAELLKYAQDKRALYALGLLRCIRYFTLPEGDGREHLRLAHVSLLPASLTDPDTAPRN